jgi:glycerol-3-phosphate O-acyltransferase
VLLGSRHRGLLREQFVSRMRETVALLSDRGATLTHALSADTGGFSESIAFLERSDLVEVAHDPRGEIVFYSESRLRALDIYRNSIVHFLAPASFAAREWIAGTPREHIVDEVQTWLEVFSQEYFVERGEALRSDVEGILDYFESRGWLAHEGAPPTSYLACLAEQTRGPLEAYSATLHALANCDGRFARKALLKQAGEMFERGRLLGEAERGEAGNATTFGNALDWLLRCEVVARDADVDSDSGDRHYARGESWVRLPELTARLAAALSDG